MSFAESFDAATGLTTFRFNGTVWPCARNATELAGVADADVRTQEPFAFLPPPGTGVCPPNAFCFVDAPWLDPPSQCGCSINYSRTGFGCHQTRAFGHFEAAVALSILIVSAACGLVCFLNLLALVWHGTHRTTATHDSDKRKSSQTTRQKCFAAMSKARTLCIAWGLGWAIGDVVLQAIYASYFIGDGSLAFQSPAASAAFAGGLAITCVCVSMTFVTIALAWLETADKVSRLSAATRTLLARYRVAVGLWCVLLIAMVVGLTVIESNGYILLISIIALTVYTIAYLAAFFRIRAAIGDTKSSSSNPSTTDSSVVLRRVYRAIAFNALGVALCTATGIVFAISSLLASAAMPRRRPLDTNPPMLHQQMFFVMLACDEVLFVMFLDRVVGRFFTSKLREVWGSHRLSSSRGGLGLGVVSTTGGAGANNAPLGLVVPSDPATVASLPVAP